MKRLVLLIVLAVVAFHVSRKHRCSWACDEPASLVLVKADGNESEASAFGTRIAAQRRASARLHRLPQIALASQLPSPPAPPAPPESVTAPKLSEAPEAPEAPKDSPDPDATPKWFEQNDVAGKQSLELNGLRTIKGRQSADEPRAEADAHLMLEKAIADWLIPEVPRSWNAPKRLVDSAIVDRHVQPVDHDYGTLYKTGYRVDFTPRLRSQLIDVYHREIGTHRLIMLGGGLAFTLVCLAALAGYIRTDEATKGYYTNRLRLAAAVGVGAAGMAIARMIAHV